MNTHEHDANAQLDFHMDGASVDEKAVHSANQSAEGGKPLNDLQKGLLKKFAAETTFIRGSQSHKTAAEAIFIGGAQTRKTDAETLLLEVRKLEAQAEIERLKVERLKIEADVGRIGAERKERNANTLLTYGSMIGKTIVFLVVVYMFSTIYPF